MLNIVSNAMQANTCRNPQVSSTCFSYVNQRQGYNVTANFTFLQQHVAPFDFDECGIRLHFWLVTNEM